MDHKDRIIAALDVPTLAEAEGLAGELGPKVGALKAGLELLTAEGAPKVVSALSRYGRLFLDAKFKDIPNTVAGAARSAARLGVWMFNVHCMGGSEMMKAARLASIEEAEKLNTTPPLVIGVTVLTSLDVKALAETGVGDIKETKDIKERVVLLALLAKRAGLDGVVASPQEVRDIRAACGKDFLIVTPGVRPTWAARGDQRRVTTPREAIESGADYLVIGRPITDPPKEIGTPAGAIEKILEEIE
jgi:orotidine-5'-phosphate decarboxylase